MKKLMFIPIFLAALSLCGCGEVKSTKELQRYAKQNFGKATMTSKEETTDSTTCYFIDKKYGFEYYVTSGMTTFGIDGSTLFDYPSTTTNYPEELYHYFEPELSEFAAEHDTELLEKGIEIDYDGHIENYLRRADLAFFTNVSEEDLDEVKEYADSLIAYFEKLDRKDVFQEVDVTIWVIGEQNPTSYP